MKPAEHSGFTPVESSTQDARLHKYINRAFVPLLRHRRLKRAVFFFFWMEPTPRPPSLMPGNVTRAVQPETPGRLVSSLESSRVRQMSLGMLRGAFTSTALSVPWSQEI